MSQWDNAPARRYWGGDFESVLGFRSIGHCAVRSRLTARCLSMR